MTTTDRSNGKANALGVIAVCVVIVVAGFACHPKRPPSQPAVRSASEEVMVNLEQETADPTMRGPLSYDHGFPVGWPHNLASAEDAAVTAVRATDRITEAGPLARRDLILTIATDEYGPTLAAETNQRIADLSFAVAGSGAGPADLTWGEYPLMFTSNQRDPDEVEVKVWSVIVLTAGDQSIPQQIWRTSTITMRWTGDDWKIDRWDSEAGPTPAPQPETPIAGTDIVDEVLGWKPSARRGQ